MINEALVVKNVYKNYGLHKALQDVSISIPSKCIYGLLGPNGAGKTSLIRIITQIIEADQGSIFINGDPLKPQHVELMGYMPEERGLYKKMKVGEQLLYLAQLKGLSKTDANSNVKKWLEKLEMISWVDKKVEDLSKGMQQKVQFIATIVHNPPIIILDEPFSGFDPMNASVIRNEILQLKENGSTIIFSTHRMETVEELCDHVALIDKGKKILDNSLAEIKRSFNTSTFLIKHRGDLVEIDNLYKIVDMKPLENDQCLTEIKLNSDLKLNQVLAEIVKYTEIISMNEKVPDMKDIFITMVNENSNA